MSSKANAALIIINGTIIDGNSQHALEGRSIWIEGERIKAIGARDEIGLPKGAKVVDARGKFVIPGLMNANVHLLGDVRLENLVRYMDRYEELIVESAQIALKNGLTTVFDTWGPRRFLIAARNSIDAGERPGSRIFCAGNIIGIDGPFSQDFVAKAVEHASAALVKRINAIWAENVGRHLMWLTTAQVAEQVRTYIDKGIDFIKYGSNDHHTGSFLTFSQQTQTAIVEEAHRAGITAQAHTMSVEGLRIAIEAGCDLIQHANITGPVSIPETTLELMARHGTGAVIFPWTKRGLDWIMDNTDDAQRTMWRASDVNVRNLIRSGAPLLLANDGSVFGPEMFTDPWLAKTWLAVPAEDSLIRLDQGHIAWFKAMEEKECPPMEMLKAATKNIAVAYGKDKDLGTLERGKIADMLVLDKNPLQAAENYRSIHTIIKEGAIVDRNALPLTPMLTKPMEPVEEEASYVHFLGGGRAPMCPMCMHR